MSLKPGNIAGGNSSQLRSAMSSSAPSATSAEVALREMLLKFAFAIRENIRSSSINEEMPVFFGTDPLPQRVNKMSQALGKEMFTIKLKQAVLKRMSSMPTDNSEDSTASMRKAIMSILEEMKMTEVIGMIGISMYEKISASALYRSPFDHKTLCKARTAQHETVKCIQEIRIAWEEGINEELQAMAVEMRRPFARPLDTPQHPLLDTLVSVSARESVRFLFDSEDLLETAAAILDSNISRSARERSLGLLKIPLITPTLSELSKRYHEFHAYAMQFGIDDLSARNGVRFSQTRHMAVDDAVKHPLDVMSARKQLRSGVPPSLRGKMWRIALGLAVDVSVAEREEYTALLKHCNREELLTDDLYIMDVLSVSDDTTYFVFDDNMREVALCFSRDSSITRDADYLIHTPLYLSSNGPNIDPTKQGGNGSVSAPVASPPNGIQPFLGFARYIAPLCYLYLDNIAIYTTMRAMYCRLWCAMNVISSSPGTLYHVCQTFERLLIEGNMRLYSHLIGLKVEPLQARLRYRGTLSPHDLILLRLPCLGYSLDSLDCLK